MEHLLIVAPRCMYLVILQQPGVQPREEESPDGESGCLRGPGGGHGGQDAKASRRFLAEGELRHIKQATHDRSDGPESHDTASYTVQHPMLPVPDTSEHWISDLCSKHSPELHCSTSCVNNDFFSLSSCFRKPAVKRQSSRHQISR